MCTFFSTLLELKVQKVLSPTAFPLVEPLTPSVLCTETTTGHRHGWRKPMRAEGIAVIPAEAERSLLTKDDT